MHPVEPSLRDPPGDRAATEAHVDELAAGHDPVLIRGELCDLALARGAFCIHLMHKCDLDRLRPRADRTPRMESGATSEQDLRQQALERLKKRRDFKGHVLIYFLVNVFLVVIWAISSDGDDFFWPIFPIVGWGIAVVMNAWDVYGRKPITEDEKARLGYELDTEFSAADWRTVIALYKARIEEELERPFPRQRRRRLPDRQRRQPAWGRRAGIRNGRDRWRARRLQRQLRAQRQRPAQLAGNSRFRLPRHP
jgi:hypothetical protein